MDTRSIDTADCTATAHDEGALVLRWAPEGHRDVLFVSRETRLGVGVEVHGGLPLCAPWFGKGRAGMTVPRPHGLVRWVQWSFEGTTESDAGTTHRWTLSAEAIADVAGAELYPDDIWFTYTATFGRELTVELTAGAGSDFVLDEAIHCYFAVDYPGATVTGLEGFGYVDHATYTRGTVEGPLSPQAYIDAVYDGSGPVDIVDGDRIIHLEPTGTQSTVVWNPGPDNAAALIDFGDDEWRQMLCVEVGNVYERPVQVPAGGSHTMGLTISVR